MTSANALLVIINIMVTMMTKLFKKLHVLSILLKHNLLNVFFFHLIIDCILKLSFKGTKSF